MVLMKKIMMSLGMALAVLSGLISTAHSKVPTALPAKMTKAKKKKSKPQSSNRNNTQVVFSGSPDNNNVINSDKATVALTSGLNNNITAASAALYKQIDFG